MWRLGHAIARQPRVKEKIMGLSEGFNRCRPFLLFLGVGEGQLKRDTKTISSIGT